MSRDKSAKSDLSRIPVTYVRSKAGEKRDESLGWSNRTGPFVDLCARKGGWQFGWEFNALGPFVANIALVATAFSRIST